MQIINSPKAKNKFIVPILSFIVIILVFLSGFLLGRAGFSVAFENGDIKYQLKGRFYPEEKDVDFNLFWEVWNMLESKYVDKSLDKQKMVEGAIKGMVSSLDDPATIFYTAKETQEYESDKAGKLEGIGIELGYLENQVIVKRIIENSPAEQNDLKPGDIIKKIDGQDATSFSISEVASKIRGEKGTKVSLTLLRDGEEINKEVTRDEVYVKSIVWEKQSDNTVTITIRRFTEDNYNDFVLRWDQVVSEVQAENPKGVILDLRGNGGGYLDGAVYIASEFLKKGDVVLYVQNREGTQTATKVERQGKWLNLPVVILVDYGTASSSEIFSGAMQYHKRAIIIGEQTYGKGTAQDVLEPASWGGASIHITTQKWLLPDKRWITKDNPIIPDIEVTITPEQLKKGEDPQLQKAVEEVGGIN